MEVRYPHLLKYRKGDVIGYSSGDIRLVAILLQDVEFRLEDGGRLFKVWDITDEWNEKEWYALCRDISPLYINRGDRFKPVHLFHSIDVDGHALYKTGVLKPNHLVEFVGMNHKIGEGTTLVPLEVHQHFSEILETNFIKIQELNSNLHLKKEKNKNLEYNSLVAQSKLKKELESKNLKKDSECSYGNISTNGNVCLQINDICHFRLYANPEDELAAIYNSFTPYFRSGKKDYLEAVAMLFEWVVMDSPWADCFLTKDVGQIMYEGYFLDVTKDAGLVYSATIVMREATEFPNRARMFRHFFNKGIDGYIAWILAHKISIDEEDYYSLCSWENGHSLFGDLYSIENVVQFLRNGLKVKGSPAYLKNKDFQISNQLLKGFNKDESKVYEFFNNRGIKVDRYDTKINEECICKIVQDMKEIV